MARINTSRPEAAMFNGRIASFVRDVTPMDGPSFNSNVDQTIVRIDGNELYFFSNEVVLTDEERDGAEKAAAKAKEDFEAQRDESNKRAENRKKEFAKTKRGERVERKGPDGEALSDEDAARAEQREGDEARAKAIADQQGRNEFNRLPGDRDPNRVQTDGLPANPNPGFHTTVTRPGDPMERPIPGPQPGSEGALGRPSQAPGVSGGERGPDEERGRMSGSDEERARLERQRSSQQSGATRQETEGERLQREHDERVANQQRAEDQNRNR